MMNADWQCGICVLSWLKLLLRYINPLVIDQWIYIAHLPLTYLLMHLLTHWKLTTFCFLSGYRQHHKGQAIWGDDADWLRSNWHQDPPHQVFHHPTFAPGQPYGHVLPELPDRQPGRASCRRPNGVVLRSPAAPVIFYNSLAKLMNTKQNKTPQLTLLFFFFACWRLFEIWCAPADFMIEI